MEKTAAVPAPCSPTPDNEGVVSLQLVESVLQEISTGRCMIVKYSCRILPETSFMNCAKRLNKIAAADPPPGCCPWTGDCLVCVRVGPISAAPHYIPSLFKLV